MNSLSQTLVHRFAHWASSMPTRVYMTQPLADGSVQTLTWAQAWHQAQCFATALKALDLPAGSSIGLLGRNSAHWMLADVGIWLAGHVSVPLYPTLNAATARHVIEHAEIRAMVIGKLDGKADSWFDIEPILPAEMPLFGLPMSPRRDVPQWDQIIAQTPLTNWSLPERDQLATIIYTSGSTGMPKGVMHSFGNMMAVCESLGELFELSSDDRLLSYLPLAHAAERSFVESLSLFFGTSVFFAHQLDTFQADLKRARPTVFLSVPRLWTKFYLGIQSKIPARTQRILFATPLLSGLLKRRILRELGMDAIRVAVTGSAPLPATIIQWFRTIGLELLDCYGMSENFATSHASRPGEVRVGYVGSTVPGVSCRIADDGEILVKSPGQMLGYYKDPEKTAAEMTDDGYFRTGDRGEIDELGRLRITGRVKELFKTGKGKYVAPAPIEQLLGNSALVESICVTGSGFPQPFALMILAESMRAQLADGTLSHETLLPALEALRLDVNAELEKHEQLAFLVIVDALWTIDNGMLTPTLKIRRSAIEDRYVPQAEGWFAQKKAVIWL